METHQDPNLLAQLRDGDESAFDALFRGLYAPLCRYAATLTGGDWDEAEDLVQQAFVKLWEQRATLEVRHSLRAYLYKAVHNRALNRLRAAHTRDRHRAELARSGDWFQEAPHSDLHEHLHKALVTLPPQCRLIFELSRFEELKYREIADHLDLSVKTVETQMGKALRLLRHQLADFLALLIFFFTTNP